MKHLRGAAGIILSLIFAVCFMCSPAFAASRLYQGMDVSSWQGDIDFQKQLITLIYDYWSIYGPVWDWNMWIPISSPTMRKPWMQA